GADPADHLGPMGRGDRFLHQLHGTVAGCGVHPGGGVGDAGGAGCGRDVGVRRVGVGRAVGHESSMAVAEPVSWWVTMPWLRAVASGSGSGYFPEKQAVHRFSSGCPEAAIIPSSELWPRESAPSERAISSCSSPLAISSARVAKSMP